MSSKAEAVMRGGWRTCTVRVRDHVSPNCALQVKGSRTASKRRTWQPGAPGTAAIGRSTDASRSPSRCVCRSTGDSLKLSRRPVTARSCAVTTSESPAQSVTVRLGESETVTEVTGGMSASGMIRRAKALPA